MRSRAARTSSSVGSAVDVAFAPQLYPGALAGFHSPTIDIVRGGQVLDRQPQRLEEGDLLRRRPPFDLPEQHVAQLADDVVVPQRPLAFGNEEITCLGEDRLAAVGE